MYNVSEKFKNAIKSTNRNSTIYGVLTTSNGTEYLLNDGNIIKDSLYVTNQIVNNSKLCFGAVYAGECGHIHNFAVVFDFTVVNHRAGDRTVLNVFQNCAFGNMAFSKEKNSPRVVFSISSATASSFFSAAVG